MSFGSKTMRMGLFALGLLGALALPSWVPLFCILALALSARAAEAIVLGFLIDLLWLPTGTPFEFVPFFSIASIILVWGLEPLRVEFLR